MLDFAGGTGFSFFALRNFIAEKEIEYYVYDAFQKLYKCGEMFKNDNDNLSFLENLEDLDSTDIIFCNVSIHYLPNYKASVDLLLKTKPKYVIFTSGQNGYSYSR